MPNTKSAERRMRGNERKRLHNRAIASRLRKLEKGLRDSVADGKKADATKALPGALSAVRESNIAGVIAVAAANRKNSRLSMATNRAK